MLQISQEIGKVHVLSFGNSRGDDAMHNNALGKSKYKSAAFIIIADEASRDHASREKDLTPGEQWHRPVTTSSLCATTSKLFTAPAW